MSVAEPGPKGMTSRMGFDGYAWATAAGATAANRDKASKRAIISPPLLFTGKCRFGGAEIFELGGNRFVRLDLEEPAERAGDKKVTRLKPLAMPHFVCQHHARKEGIGEGVAANRFHDHATRRTHDHAHRGEVEVLPIAAPLGGDVGARRVVVGKSFEARRTVIQHVADRAVPRIEARIDDLQ